MVGVEGAVAEPGGLGPEHVRALEIVGVDVVGEVVGVGRGPVATHTTTLTCRVTES